MNKTTDENARRTAVLDHDRSLIVEAGAGTGKTTLLAARIAMLIANGAEPAKIAAITFTELAAAELAARARGLVEALARDGTTPELKPLIGTLSEAKRAHLAAAAGTLNEMTCTTIHGFCRTLLDTLAPPERWVAGSGVEDALTSARARAEELGAWVQARAALDDPDADLLAERLVDDPEGTLELLAAIGANDSAESAPHPPGATPGEAAAQLEANATAFAQALERAAVQEPDTTAMAGEAAALARECRRAAPIACQALEVRPGNTLVTTTGTWRAYRKKGKWTAAAKAAGRKSTEGAELATAAQSHLETIAADFGTFLETAAEQVRGGLRRLARDARAHHAAAKRLRASADFDDLISGARALLAESAQARKEAAVRTRHLLVDEFQDTDAEQAEIVWRIGADANHEGPWRTAALRPGALFLVGDPKQAIYGFRGADVANYVETRERMRRTDPTSVITVNANFRSRPAVINWANARFENVLSGSGQAGFTALEATRTAEPPGEVLRLDLGSEPDAGSSGAQREREAEAVATLIARWLATETHGAERPGDIALLAPAGTGLWRYEEALAKRSIAVATQAGKGLFLRQEVKDLIAIVRLLAAPGDRIALGALLRGPLVGVTDETLLDIALHLGAVAKRRSGLAPLDATTPPATLTRWPLVAETVAIIADIAARAPAMTPHRALAEAMAGLEVRALVAERDREGGRACANLDRVLEMAKSYAAQGINAFASDLHRGWREGARLSEGRPDGDADAVALVTMHAAKGLEWPSVIIVNTHTTPRWTRPIVLAGEHGDATLRVNGIACAGYEAASERAREALERERERLWYVACTRARERLVVTAPGLGHSWGNIIDLDAQALALATP